MTALLRAFWPGFRLSGPLAAAAAAAPELQEPQVIDYRWSGAQRVPFSLCALLAPLFTAEKTTSFLSQDSPFNLPSALNSSEPEAASEGNKNAASAASTASELPVLSVAFSPGGAYTALVFETLLAAAFPGRELRFRRFPWLRGTDAARRMLDEEPLIPDLLVVSILDCVDGCVGEWLWSMRGEQTIVLMVSGEPWYFLPLLADLVDVYVTSVTEKTFLPPPLKAVEYMYMAEAAMSLSPSDRRFATPLDLLAKEKGDFDAEAVLASKDRAVAYQYSKCYNYRDAFFDLLSERLPVYATGDCHGSLPADSPLWEPDGTRRVEWFRDLSVEHLRRYKFAIASEAVSLEGYITEKLVNPMLANTIPIYVGSQTAQKYFNSKSFFDCGRYPSLAACADAVKEVDANRTAYLEMLRQPWITQENMEELFSWHPAVESDAFAKRLAGAIRRARKRRLELE